MIGSAASRYPLLKPTDERHHTPGIFSSNASEQSLSVGHMAPGAQVIYIGPSRLEDRWHQQIGFMPRQADCFQVRHYTVDLWPTITDRNSDIRCHIISGTGGVGKTQLAAYLARRSWQQGNLDLLLWVTATTREAIVSAYARTAVNLIKADPTDPESAASSLLARLESSDRRWLIVLDDLSDPRDMHGLWPPVNSRGVTLVTTRRRDAALTGDYRKRIDVEPFTRDEAIEYLASQLAIHGREDSWAQIGELAKNLGYLPLALAQAAAYMIDLNIDCREYRDRLGDRARTLYDVAPDISGLPDDQSHTVWAVWDLSIERAQRLRPQGMALPELQLASMLDPNGIPLSILTSPPAIDFVIRHRSRVAGDTPGPAEITMQSTREAECVRAAISCLYRLSLIEYYGDNPPAGIRVHNLIQRAVLDKLSLAERDQLASTAAEALLSAWPRVEPDRSTGASLRANAAALAEKAGEALWHDGGYAVLYRAGNSLGEAGHVRAAVPYWENMARISATYLGSDHPGALKARHHWGYWLGEAGNIEASKATLTGLLEDRKRIMGFCHPDTLDTRHNLARRIGETGDAHQAAESFSELLVDCLRVLGPDHYRTLSTRGNLARWRGEAGDPATAVDSLRTLFRDQEHILGADHLYTLTTRFNLARWIGEAGDAEAAARAFAELVADQERVLGADHPFSLSNRANLAHWRGKAGDLDGAVQTLEELLRDQVQILGADHPRTLATQAILIHWVNQNHLDS